MSGTRKAVLVTDASRGVGRAAARLFAESGALKCRLVARLESA